MTKLSFSQKIYEKCVALLGSNFSGGIYSHHLPDNYDREKPVMLIQYRLQEKTPTLDGESNDVMYDLNLIIISQSSAINETLSESVVFASDLLTDSQILDVSYQDDLNDFDDETELYIKSINFQVTYNH